MPNTPTSKKEKCDHCYCKKHVVEKILHKKCCNCGNKQSLLAEIKKEEVRKIPAPKTRTDEIIDRLGFIGEINQSGRYNGEARRLMNELRYGY